MFAIAFEAAAVLPHRRDEVVPTAFDDARLVLAFANTAPAEKRMMPSNTAMQHGPPLQGWYQAISGNVHDENGWLHGISTSQCIPDQFQPGSLRFDNYSTRGLRFLNVLVDLFIK